ncbi:hypothetical protein PSECIP111951_01710 [Pseudoalteromonas holothuriae]|uniref:Uncharacterized protein n=1 Tax=Pseudoalteromonas holothuriae TaxID=2963714 RepID=A0A9W4QT99_9GAMM|nr:MULTISPECIES: hypothetical protein [unclassified Pseudoalteromonas]CAH9052093.1 hypothetical protein PSECIP111854_00898 [Pseudoalteromonas sp. CIP111854]CAH9057646.1 hypothetical protein PSECIP111951_01710 [Pseudoalteromonas sp. CIP111951]
MKPILNKKKIKNLSKDQAKLPNEITQQIAGGRPPIFYSVFVKCVPWTAEC